MLNITANGYLGSDPEERQFNGNTVVNFSLGSKDRKQNTLWLYCSVWGNSGNAAKQWLKKGSQITVHGRLSQNSYSKDGQERTSLNVDVQDFTLPPKMEPQVDNSANDSFDEDIPF